MADEISGGDVYFARGGPRDPLAALPRENVIRKINGIGLLHKEASLWKDRYDLSETKRVRQGAGGGGAHSIAA